MVDPVLFQRYVMPLSYTPFPSLLMPLLMEHTTYLRELCHKLREFLLQTYYRVTFSLLSLPAPSTILRQDDCVYLPHMDMALHCHYSRWVRSIPVYNSDSMCTNSLFERSHIGIGIQCIIMLERIIDLLCNCWICYWESSIDASHGINAIAVKQVSTVPIVGVVVGRRWYT